MSERKYVGGGWKKVTDKGTYISLSFNSAELQNLDLANCWVSLVKNERKQKESHPDYNITATPKNGAPQKKVEKVDDFGF